MNKRRNYIKGRIKSRSLLYYEYETYYKEATLEQIESEIIEFTDKASKPFTKYYYTLLLLILAVSGGNLSIPKMPFSQMFKSLNHAIIAILTIIIIVGLIIEDARRSPQSRIEYLKMKREKLLREEKEHAPTRTARQTIQGKSSKL